MTLWIVTDDKGDTVYFIDKQLMIAFCNQAFTRNSTGWTELSRGIHSSSWGSPFWIREKMIVV